MEFTDEIMNRINTAIAEYLDRRSKVDPTGMPMYAPSLAYSLNNIEIDAAEDELRRTNQTICVVKTNNVSGVNICYYKHPSGNYTIGMDFSNQLLTIS